MSWIQDNLFGSPSPQPQTIDQVLRTRIRPDSVAAYRTAFKQLPAFRFVDLYNAIETLLGHRTGTIRIDSQNHEDLNSLLHAPQPNWAFRKLTRAQRLAWPTSAADEVLLPADRFWIAPHESGTHRMIVRLRFISAASASFLEVASADVKDSEALMDQIVSTSARDSVYRNAILEIGFQTASKDEYGDVEKAEQLRVTFKHLEPVADRDLIIDDDVRRILTRNVIDLHERRDVLKSIGVPIRRGVLLYGPPGTGKTYACRYLCGKLTDVTRILVTGSALLHVGQVFQLARLLQPSIVFLEDVDLVFMSREINLYSSVLGELLDHMDGLRPFEDIGFELTTNAINRMEEAVRDRPGRISQCIRFGAPGAALRSRYLEHYLQRYDCSQVDHEGLVRDSEGATQAFLKEWVHRAVQVGSERMRGVGDRLNLTTADFEEALDEMKSHSSGSTGRIIGFGA